ncbi:PREDICTED: microtubule-associated protein SPIRAL2-like [Tarenaya hassleriana]|uniref:microtubule-associated protein SPIRAL2-like n=1 Tax=Tarenaya hassleriana TaxID=28532 RepID=UPI00053C0FE4|nr:PREDICTED: microtubule-associated protein SPIRAL2-like [Tarenaya hassleriana]
MSSQVAVKPSKSTKPSSRSSNGAVSSHLAMVELKQRILTSLSRLGDRDTYQIAVDDLEKVIVSVTPETLQVFLNCLFDFSSDSKPAVKKESLRLLSFLCLSHRDLTSAQLAKIIAHIVKRLKDADPVVRDACRDAIGSLSAQFLREEEDGNGGGAGALVGLFAKPLFEAMAEQNKSLQAGAAICMAKMVESAAEPPVPAFQKLCPRICKLLNSPNYLTKSSLLPVVGNLSQVGAIAPQSLESLLQSIHECLGSTDWVTRKAAADALIALAMHCSTLIADKTDSTITVLEACRFDKIKPVRDSLTEALNAWKNIAGTSENGTFVIQKDVLSEQSKLETNGESASSTIKGSSDQPGYHSDYMSKVKTGAIPEKVVLILRKKAPRLNDKDLNPDFFKKLEKNGSGDLPVEVVLPRAHKKSPNSKEDESEASNSGLRGRPIILGETGTDGVGPKQRYFGDFAREKWVDERMNGGESRIRAFDGDQNDGSRLEVSGNHAGVSLKDNQYEGSLINNGGSWFSLQRQLLNLERQQTHIMNMLQDFMGGSHDGMINLENRVRDLERIIEEMARDFSISSGVSGRRAASWRSDLDGLDYPQYGASRNGQTGTRRSRGSGSTDTRLSKSETSGDHTGSRRRAWDKGPGFVRLGEGPSARSIWKASKDEATLEAIRVAGEDSQTSITRQDPIPEADGTEEDKEEDPVWTSWNNAMHSLQVGDTDSAFAEVFSTGDDHLLVKLMERSGPALDQLSNDVGNEALHAIGQLLLDDLNLFEICLSWIQQLLELVAENGPDFLDIPMELKKDLLLNLYEASSTIDPSDDWEGLPPDDLLVQLASNWRIELQHFD